MSELDQIFSKKETEPHEDCGKLREPTQISHDVPDRELNGGSKGVSDGSQPPSKMPEPDDLSNESDNESDESGNSDKSPPDSLFEDSSDDDEGKTCESEILGAPKGQCQRCKKRKAFKACFNCATGEFCSDWCYELSMEKGQHRCIPAPETTGTKLFDAVAVDRFPQDKQTLDDYYFGHAASIGAYQRQKLLGVYSDLVKTFGISGPQLNQWKEARQIYNNCVRVFNRYPRKASVKSFFWLMQNRNAFLEEDRSEVPDYDAYLRANHLTQEQFLGVLAFNM